MADGDSWWFKLARAEQHLDDLDIEIARYANTYPYEVVRRPQPKGNKHVWTYALRFTALPHAKIPLLIGDAAHNMRTALDHLAVALSPGNEYLAGLPIEDRPIWATNPDGSWVIENDEPRCRYDEAVKGMRPRVKAIIDGLQPYHFADNLERSRHPLHIIRVLDNADKHRTIIATHPGINGPVTMLSRRGGTPEERWFSHQVGLCHDGAVIAGFNFSDIDPKRWPTLESEMDVEVRGPLHVTLEVAKERGFIDAPVELRGCLENLAADVVPVLEAEVGQP
jgi:hypothetical protein